MARGLRDLVVSSLTWGPPSGTPVTGDWAGVQKGPSSFFTMARLPSIVRPQQFLTLSLCARCSLCHCPVCDTPLPPEGQACSRGLCEHEQLPLPTTEEQWHWAKARRLVCVCVPSTQAGCFWETKYRGLRADSHLEPGADSHLPRTTAVSSIKVHHGLHLLNTSHLVVSTLTCLCAPGCWEGGWPGLVVPGRPAEAMPASRRGIGKAVPSGLSTQPGVLWSFGDGPRTIPVDTVVRFAPPSVLHSSPS